MKRKKVTEEQVEQFYAALPDDKRVVRAQMFGMKLGKVGDYHFAERNGQGVMVRVPERQRDELLAKGGVLWEPMPGRPRPDLVVLPDNLSGDPKQLALWIRLAFDHCLALPPKAPKRPKKKRSTPQGTRRPMQSRTRKH